MGPREPLVGWQEKLAFTFHSETVMGEMKFLPF